MLSYDEACALIDSAVTPLPVERADLLAACGRILAAPIAAALDVPAFTNSAMDGFAVRADDIRTASADAPARLRLLETVVAGSRALRNVTTGTCIGIMTGAPLPEGADTVVPVEDTSVDDREVSVRTPLPAGTHVRAVGQEAQAGDCLQEAGTRVTPASLGLASSQGLTALDVYGKPRVAILITGDEVLRPGSAPEPHKVIDAAGPALQAALTADLMPPVFIDYVGDNPARVQPILNFVLHAVDAAVIVGGASMGTRDIVQDVARAIGVEELFWKVAVKPGKPLWFGRRDAVHVFNVPGNPVSVLVSYCLFVRRYLLQCAGVPREDATLASCAAELTAAIAKNTDRCEYVRGVLEGEPGALRATPLAQRGSAMLSGMAQANCLIELKAEEVGWAKGDTVRVLRLPW